MLREKSSCRLSSLEKEAELSLITPWQGQKDDLLDVIECCSHLLVD